MSFLVRWAAPHPPASSSGGGTQPPAITSPAQCGRHASAVPAAAVPSSPEAAKVALLMKRVQTCTVAKDKRDALADLCQMEECGVYMTREQLRGLLELLAGAAVSASSSSSSSSSGDPDVQARVVEIIANVTDEKLVGDSQTRDGFLREILVHGMASVMPLLRQQQHHAGGGGGPSEAGGATSSGTGGRSDGSSGTSFWTKYRVAQLLQRLLEHDTEGLQAALLACHGVDALVDLLHDESNGGALRNEGVSLVSLLTASNAEIQTILAFENCFDRLFGIVRKEVQGGDVSYTSPTSGVDSRTCDGGDLIIVVDCLAAALNMLRGNKASQKYFLETGMAKMLVPLLTDKPDGLSGGAGGSAGGSSSSSPLPKLLQSAASSSSSSSSKRFTVMGNNIVYSAVAILSTLLRGGDSHGDGPSVRTTLAHSGIVLPLSTVALSQAHTLDDGTSLEALSVLVSLLHGNKPCCEQFLGVKLTVPSAALLTGTFVGGASPQPASLSTAVTSTTGAWVAVWLTLDPAKQGTAVDTVGTSPGASSSSTKGSASAASQAAAHALKMQLGAYALLCTLLAPSSGVAVQAASLVGKNMTPIKLGIGKLQPENHAGFLLSGYLFSTVKVDFSSPQQQATLLPSVLRRAAAAALVLDSILQVPQVQEQLLHIQWTTTCLPAVSASDGGGAVAPPPPPATLFNVYLRWAALLYHHFADFVPTAGQLSTPPSSSDSHLVAGMFSALLRPLLTWLTYSGKTPAMALQDPAAIRLLITSPAQANTSPPAELRLLASAVIVATLSSPAASVPSGAAGPQEKAVAGLQTLFHDAIGAQRLREWHAIVASTPEWAVAASADAGSSQKQQQELFLPVVADKFVVTSIKETIEALASGKMPHSASGPLLPAASLSSFPAIHCETLSDVEDNGPAMDAAAAKPSTAAGAAARSPVILSSPITVKSPLMPQGAAASLPATLTSSGDGAYPGDGTAGGDPTAHPAGADLMRAEQNHWADAEVRRLLSANAAQQLEILQLRKQLSESTSTFQEQLSAVQQQLTQATAQSASLTDQLATSDGKCRQLEADATEQQALLEGTLRANDEETQQLVSTLALLETRLTSTQAAVASVATLKEQLEAAVGERDELLILVAELDEEREVLRNASAIVCPPTNPPTDDDEP